MPDIGASVHREHGVLVALWQAASLSKPGTRNPESEIPSRIPESGAGIRNPAPEPGEDFLPPVIL